MIQNFIQESPYAFALNRYDKKYAEALLGNIDKLKGVLKECAYQKDSRSSLEYAQDIIYSWIVEDYIKEQIQKCNSNIQLNGCDKYRELLVGKKVTNATDFLIDIDDKIFNIELVVNYTNFWQNYWILHLRDFKLQSLIEKSKNKNLILMGIDIINRKYFMIKIHSNMKFAKIAEHRAFGFKPACELSIPYFKDFNDIGEIYQDIIGVN